MKELVDICVGGDRAVRARVDRLIRMNLNLVIVVALSFSLQVWSHQNETLGRFLKTSSLSLAACFLLLAVGGIPLMFLELVKVVRDARRQRKTEP